MYTPRDTYTESHPHTKIHTHIHTHTQTYIDTQTVLHTGTYTQRHKNIHMNRQTHIKNIDTHIPIHTYTQAHTQKYTYPDTNTYPYIRNTYTKAHRLIQTHTHIYITHRYTLVAKVALLLIFQFLPCAFTSNIQIQPPPNTLLPPYPHCKITQVLVRKGNERLISLARANECKGQGLWLFCIIQVAGVSWPYKSLPHMATFMMLL